MTGVARQAQQDAYRLVNAGTGIVEVRRVVGDLRARSQADGTEALLPVMASSLRTATPG
jgi:hypothetical protein